MSAESPAGLFIVIVRTRAWPLRSRTIARPKRCLRSPASLPARQRGRLAEGGSSSGARELFTRLDTIERCSTSSANASKRHGFASGAFSFTCAGTPTVGNGKVHHFASNLRTKIVQPFQTRRGLGWAFSRHPDQNRFYETQCACMCAKQVSVAARNRKNQVDLVMQDDESLEAVSAAARCRGGQGTILPHC